MIRMIDQRIRRLSANRLTNSPLQPAGPHLIKSGLRRTLSQVTGLVGLAAVMMSSCSPVAPPQDLTSLHRIIPEICKRAAPFRKTSRLHRRPSIPSGRDSSPVSWWITQPRPEIALPQLAVRFNTSVEEILEANSFIPKDATTMPPGMPMKIPIYYLPLWGSPYQILPDSLFVNGPSQVDFDIEKYVRTQQGWLKDYSGYVSEANRSGAQIVELVAHNYSISPRLLLALLEYQSQALSDPIIKSEEEQFPLGFQRWDRKGLFLQLAWAANLLNQGYYNYRSGGLTEIELKDGRLERIDPWQNAATASLHNFYNNLFEYDQYAQAISPEGLSETYRKLFGDPWQAPAHLPGSLAQPSFLLPFEPGDVWALTGGPHAGWGTSDPLSALDFAPPSKSAGCVYSDRWATAVADGVVVRSEEGQVMLDLDGDGDERTGWNIFYLHIGTGGRVPLGAKLKRAIGSAILRARVARRLALIFILPASITASGCLQKVGVGSWRSTWKDGRLMMGAKSTWGRSPAMPRWSLPAPARMQPAG